jgi:histone H3/H4
MTLTEINKIYYQQFLDNNESIDKKVIRRIIKKFGKEFVNVSNIVSVYINDIFLEPEFNVAIIDYTYFYKDKEITYKKSDIFLYIHYMAIIKPLSVNEIVDIINALDNQNFFSEAFIEMLKMNRNLPEETKLWLKLKQ